MRIFIIEDQFVLRRQLIELIKSISSYPFEFVEVTNERNFFKEVETMSIENTDLFFIDIDLNYYRTGIDLAELIREKNNHCLIVFNTAFDDRITEIVNRQILPLGYLTKRRDPKLLELDLTIIIQKALRLLSEKEGKKQIILRRGNDELILNEKNILYIATIPSQKNLLAIHSFDQEYLIPGKLKMMKSILKGSFFIKSLKSFILNTNEIGTIYTVEGVIQFSDLSTLDIGVSGVYKVKRFLKGRIDCDTK